jgi:hypothetical protein
MNEKGIITEIASISTICRFVLRRHTQSAAVGIPALCQGHVNLCARKPPPPGHEIEIGGRGGNQQKNRVSKSISCHSALARPCNHRRINKTDTESSVQVIHLTQDPRGPRGSDKGQKKRNQGLGAERQQKKSI